MNLGQIVAIILSALLAVGYFLGSVSNRKRGVEIALWMKRGLDKVIGEVSYAKWMGGASTGAQMVVAKANEPFRRVETAFLLEAREVAPVWWYQRLKGRRDAMVVHGALRSRPRGKIASSLKGAPQADFEGEIRKFGNLHVLCTPALCKHAPLVRFLEKYADDLRALSLQPKQPHLFVKVNLPRIRSLPPEEFWRDLSEAFKLPNS